MKAVQLEGVLSPVIRRSLAYPMAAGYPMTARRGVAERGDWPMAAAYLMVVALPANPLLDQLNIYTSLSLYIYICI